MPTTRSAPAGQHVEADGYNGAAPFQRLPNEILSLIAFELAHVGWLQTLGSMCTMSKEHYYLFRPYMYRHLQLFHPDFNTLEPTTPSPWRLLHQLVQHVYESDPEQFQDVPTDKLPAYLRTAAARAQNKTFTPFLERTAMIQTIDIGHVPEPDVVEVMDMVMTNVDGWALDNIFPRLEVLALWGNFWNYDESFVDIVEVGRMIGRIVHPKHICVHYSTPNPWQPAENQGFDSDSPSLALYSLISGRPALAPYLRGFSIHDLYTGNIPSFTACGPLHVDIHFASPNAPVGCGPNGQLLSGTENVKALMYERYEQLDDLALEIDPDPDEASFSFHGVLRNEDLVKLIDSNEAQDLVTPEINKDGAPEAIIREIYMEHLARTDHTSLFAQRRWELRTPTWAKFKELIEARYTFFPSPAPGASCPHCRRPLLDWTIPSEDPDEPVTEEVMMRLPIH